MDDRSPKRRRLSGSASGEDQESPKNTPTRASYLSPTKASLSRFNPKLLQSPHLLKSPRRPTSRGTLSTPGKAAAQAEAPSRSNIATERLMRADQESAALEPRALFEDLDLGNHTKQNVAIWGRGAEGPAQSKDMTDVEQGPQRFDTTPIDPAKEGEKQALLDELTDLRRQCKRFEGLLNRTINASGEEDSGALKEASKLFDDMDIGGRNPTEQDSEVADMLNSFLPFRNPSTTSPVPGDDDDLDFDVLSHRPLELQDPLPCLQLVTPLRFSSTTEAPVSAVDPHGHVVDVQRHRISLRDEKATFFADVEFDVSTSGEESAPPRVTSLDVPKLSQWASAGLKEWIEQRRMECDIGSLMYSLGSYYEMAVRRATCWSDCERRFAPLLNDRSSAVDDNEASEGKTRGAHAQHLGRRSMQFQDAEVVLRVEWAISFDWTGEAASELSASTAFTQPFHELDSRGSLKKVPDIFEQLVCDKGVVGAVEAMVAVLFA